jgi:uncharacterized membrane protein YphA (DoxX/SURF4 family)
MVLVGGTLDARASAPHTSAGARSEPPPAGQLQGQPRLRVGWGTPGCYGIQAADPASEQRQTAQGRGDLCGRDGASDRPTTRPAPHKQRSSQVNAALHVALWGAQWFLALLFLAAGAPKLVGRGLDRWTGFSDLPRSQVVFTGVAEVLGAAGLVLPMATGVLPWLTPLAAVGLAVIGLLAAGFHVRADERLNVAETGLLAGIAAAVAVGRWDLVAFGPDGSPWLLVAALGVLVPAAIVNVVILWMRSLDQARQPQRGSGRVAGTRPPAGSGPHPQADTNAARPTDGSIQADGRQTSSWAASSPP